MNAADLQVARESLRQLPREARYVAYLCETISSRVREALARKGEAVRLGWALLDQLEKQQAEQKLIQGRSKTLGEEKRRLVEALEGGADLELHAELGRRRTRWDLSFITAD